MEELFAAPQPSSKRSVDAVLTGGNHPLHPLPAPLTALQQHLTFMGSQQGPEQAKRWQQQLLQLQSQHQSPAFNEAEALWQSVVQAGPEQKQQFFALQHTDQLLPQLPCCSPQYPGHLRSQFAQASNILVKQEHCTQPVRAQQLDVQQSYYDTSPASPPASGLSSQPQPAASDPSDLSDLSDLPDWLLPVAPAASQPYIAKLTSATSDLDTVAICAPPLGVSALRSHAGGTFEHAAREQADVAEPCSTTFVQAASTGSTGTWHGLTGSLLEGLEALQHATAPQVKSEPRVAPAAAPQQRRLLSHPAILITYPTADDADDSMQPPPAGAAASAQCHAMSVMNSGAALHDSFPPAPTAPAATPAAASAAAPAAATATNSALGHELLLGGDSSGASISTRPSSVGASAVSPSVTAGLGFRDSTARSSSAGSSSAAGTSGASSAAGSAATAHRLGSGRTSTPSGGGPGVRGGTRAAQPGRQASGSISTAPRDLGARASKGRAAGGSAGALDRLPPGAIEHMSVEEAERLKTSIAQKRYREKRKAKLLDAEQQVADLEAELQRLSLEKEEAAARNAALEAAVSRRELAALQAEVEDGNFWLDEAARQKIEASMVIRHMDETITFSLRDPPLCLTRQQVADLTFSQFSELWVEFTQAYSELLSQTSGLEGGRGADRIARLVYEFGLIRCILAIAAPKRWAEYSRTPAEGFPVHFPPSPQTWRQVAWRLQLSGQQKLSLVQLRRAYLHNLALLAKRRRAASATVAEARNRGDGYRHTAEQEAKVEAALALLKETLSAEHSFHICFTVTVYKRILGASQCAILFLTAFPLHPDLLSICNIVAEDAGEPATAAVVQERLSEEADAAEAPVEEPEMARLAEDTAHPYAQPYSISRLSTLVDRLSLATTSRSQPGGQAAMASSSGKECAG